MNAGRIDIGNAENFEETRGWFVGSFLDESAGPRRTDHLEIKYSVHAAGDGRAGVAPGAAVCSVAILLSGTFELVFPGQDPAVVVLRRPGDYVLWEAGVPHSWSAPVAARLLTVRWPEDPALLGEGAAARIVHG